MDKTRLGRKQHRKFQKKGERWAGETGKEDNPAAAPRATRRHWSTFAKRAAAWVILRKWREKAFLLLERRHSWTYRYRACVWSDFPFSAASLQVATWASECQSLPCDGAQPFCNPGLHQVTGAKQYRSSLLPAVLWVRPWLQYWH